MVDISTCAEWHLIVYIYIFDIFIGRYGRFETSIRQEPPWWSGTCRTGVSSIRGIVSLPWVKLVSKTKHVSREERLYATSIISERRRDMAVSIRFLMWCHSLRNISFSDDLFVWNMSSTKWLHRILFQKSLYCYIKSYALSSRRSW